MKIILLVTFVAVSAIYLVSLFFKQGKLQSVLKSCLVPLILAIYLFGAKRILIPVVLALIFGWIGDVLLLDITKVRRFQLGLASFLVGHVCFIVAFFEFALPLNILVLTVSVLVASIAGFFIFRFVRPDKEMKYPVIAYEVIIMLMAISAVQVFFSQSGVFGALAFIGSLCFVMSDSILAYDTFRKKSKIGYFMVMVTYILAQFLITLGFCTA